MLWAKRLKQSLANFGKTVNSSKDFEGDVKYHLGASSNREFDGNSVHISLTDNPSHLEALNPVVLGQVRTKQFFHKDKGKNNTCFNGDAAFAGQEGECLLCQVTWPQYWRNNSYYCE